LSEPVRIIEKKAIPTDAVMLQGLPDVGLVGLIAISYIISQLNLAEMAYVESDLLPPIVVLHDGLPHASIRIFGKNNLIALISETPIPAKAVQTIIRAIVEWSQTKKVNMTISLGGMPTPNRQNIEKPKVFGAASNASILDMLQKKGIEVLKEGFMVGPQALVMRYCAERNISAVALLAQSFDNYPDPEAAAETIKELNKIVEVPVNVSELLENGEEIRLRARDIMKRTQPEMARMRKSQEYDLPLYV
jgi:uncharacterized protein